MLEIIRIAIIDDDENMRKIISRHIEKAKEPEDKVEIHTFSSAEEFLEKFEEDTEYHMMFTDIQMENMSGIDLVKEIRRQMPGIYIVFITSFSEFAAESYVLEAYQYILKQDMDRRLPRVIKRLITRVKQREKQYRVIEKNSDMTKIYYRDIIYIYKVKAAKYVCYVTKDGEVRERISIEKLYSELESKQFILVERSYIVNMKHICKISDEMIYLENGNRVTISQSRIPEVKRTINQYWRDL